MSSSRFGHACFGGGPQSCRPAFLRPSSGGYFAGMARLGIPTIHEVLLERADKDGAPDRGARFIRSCSAALAPAVLTNLEKRFGAPVLEAYGLTEAAHQVAYTPPRPRKPGTVGFGTEAELAIIDETGRHLPPNRPGEVVVRGPDVMRGYRNDPEATAAAFVDGW